jgi:hypothetical protein
MMISKGSAIPDKRLLKSKGRPLGFKSSGLYYVNKGEIPPGFLDYL